MMEFIAHIASVIIPAIVIAVIVLFINRIERKRHGEYHITYEYKFFRYSYSERTRMTQELNALGKEGWDIASFAGEDHYYAYFILKRETLHTSKEITNEIN